MSAKKNLLFSLFFCCLTFFSTIIYSNAQRQNNNNVTQKRNIKGGFKSIKEAPSLSTSQLQTEVFSAASHFLVDRGLELKMDEGVYRTASNNGIDATTYIFPIEGSSRASLGAISINGAAAITAAQRQFREGAFDVERYNKKYMAQNAQESVRWMIYIYQERLPLIFYLEALRFTNDDEPVIVLTADGGKVIFNFAEGLMYILNPADATADSFWDCVKRAFNIPSSLNLLDIFVSICNLPSSCELRELVLAARSCTTCPTILGCVACVWTLADFITCTAAEIYQCYQTRGTFSLSVTPNNQTINAGQTATFIISADFIDGFPGPVTGFSVSGLPSGAFGSFTSGSITTPADATTLLITTSANTPPVTSTFTVSARGGNVTRNTQGTLMVNSNAGGAITTLSNGQAVNSIVQQGQEKYYRINVPGPVTQFKVTLTGTNDADLYVKYGSRPNENIWDCRPYESSTNEQCTFDNPATGEWYILVRGFSGTSSFTLVAQYGLSGNGSGPLRIDNIVQLTTPGHGQQFFVRIDGTGFNSNVSRVVVTGPGCGGFGACKVDNDIIRQFGYITNNRIERVPLTLASGNFLIYVHNGTSFQEPASAGFPFTVASDRNDSGNLQITFSPNPAYPNATSDCSHNYEFTIIVRETNGIGVNLSRLEIDQFPDNYLFTLSFPSRVNANGEYRGGLRWCRGTGSSTWKITGTDDQGNTRTWSGTIQLQ